MLPGRERIRKTNLPDIEKLQGLDLVNSLPKYSDNIHAKWVAIQKGPFGPLNLAFTNVGLIIADLGKSRHPLKGPKNRSQPRFKLLAAPIASWQL